MLKNFTSSALFQKIKIRTKKFELEKHLVKTIIGIFAVSFVISIIGGTSTLASSVSLPLITAIFAFLAYKYNKEKFRLELFEKRWEVCQNIAKFCSIAAIYGNLFHEPENEDKKKDLKEAYDAMGKSFKGEGYHLRSLLFSKDVEDTFKKLNEAYAFLSSYYLNSQQPFTGVEHLTNLSKIYEDLPELFKPYLYFGDYRND